MGPILFRAWLKYYHEMHIVETLDMQDNEVFINRINGNGGYHNIKDIELMQYTGLDDSSGKKIYEGDIVKSTFHSRIDGATTDIYVVEYDNVNPCFVMQSITSEYQREYDFVQVDLRTNEVIGNIYENKELLKDSK